MIDINIKDYVKQQKESLRQAAIDQDIRVKLGIVDGTREGDAANQSYIRNKIKDFNEIGWECQVYKVEDTHTYIDGKVWNVPGSQKVCWAIQKAINDNCTAIIVQLPLREGLAFDPTMIPIEYDCDGFHPMSRVRPATPAGIIDYLEACEFPFSGKTATVIGRSNIVGRPMAQMLLEKDMTVAVCHSKSDLDARRRLLMISDLVVCAAGRPHLISRKDCPNAFVVDVGINRDSEGKLCGDFDEWPDFGKYSTPVPGGVGLLTRLALMKNCFILAGGIGLRGTKM